MRPLQDRERHGAVDQEHADHEREKPECRQVRTERARELAQRAALALRRYQHCVWRQVHCERACLPFIEREIYSVDLPYEAKQLLSRCNVGDDGRLVRAGRVVGIQPEDPHRDRGAVGEQRDAVVGRDSDLLREGGRKEDGVRLEDQRGLHVRCRTYRCVEAAAAFR